MRGYWVFACLSFCFLILSHSQASRLIMPLAPAGLEVLGRIYRSVMPMTSTAGGFEYLVTRNGTAVSANIPGIPEELEGRVMLTAAHCIPLGTHTVTVSSGGSVQEGVPLIHPAFQDWNLGMRSFDLGLIILPQSFPSVVPQKTDWALKSHLDLQGEEVIQVGCGNKNSFFYREHKLPLPVLSRYPTASRSFMLKGGLEKMISTSPFGEDYRGLRSLYGLNLARHFGLGGAGDSGGPMIVGGAIVGLITHGGCGGLETVLSQPVASFGAMEHCNRLPRVTQALLSKFSLEEQAYIQACEVHVKKRKGLVVSPRTHGVFLPPYLPWIQKTLADYVRNPPRRPVKPPFVPDWR